MAEEPRIMPLRRIGADVRVTFPEPPNTIASVERGRAGRVRAEILNLVSEFEALTGETVQWQDDNEGGTIDVEDLLDWAFERATYRRWEGA